MFGMRLGLSAIALVSTLTLANAAALEWNGQADACEADIDIDSMLQLKATRRQELKQASSTAANLKAAPPAALQSEWRGSGEAATATATAAAGRVGTIGLKEQLVALEDDLHVEAAATKAVTRAADQVARSGKGSELQGKTFTRSSHVVFVVGIAVAVIILVPLFYLWFGSFVGSLARVAFETFDTSVLGVNVAIGDMVFHPFGGELEITNLVVYNPEGFTTPYLLKAGKVLIDVNTCSLLCSGFQHVVLENLIFKDISVLCEAKWSGTNVSKVLAFIEDKEGKEASSDERSEGMEQTAAQSGSSVFSRLSRFRSPRSIVTKTESTVELHQVRVHNVGVQLIGDILGQHPRVNIEAADLHWKDFQSQVGARKAAGIVSVLMRTLLKTIVSNLAGKRLSRQSCC